MPDTTERLRLLSLLAAIGELSARTGDPADGVELLDQETSYRWLLQAKPRPYASLSSLHHHGYTGGDQAQMDEDFAELVSRGYVALTVLHDAYGLTSAGLAVYHGGAEFA